MVAKKQKLEGTLPLVELLSKVFAKKAMKEDYCGG
jgi:hypothetical protein